MFSYSVFIDRIVGYSQAKGTSIGVDASIRIKQSSTANDVWVRDKLNATLADYNALPASQGIFGYLPKGHEKN